MGGSTLASRIGKRPHEIQANAAVPKYAARADRVGESVGQWIRNSLAAQATATGRLGKGKRSALRILLDATWGDRPGMYGSDFGRRRTMRLPLHSGPCTLPSAFGPICRPIFRTSQTDQNHRT